MSDLNLNVDMGNVLQPPNLNAISAQEAVVKKQGPTGTAKDTIATSDTSTATTVNLLSDNPLPEPPTTIGTQALIELGASAKTSGPGGLGNPWLGAIPTVAFSLSYQDFFRALRENKSAMGEMLIQQIGITMDLAQSAAKLVMANAEKERDQHITEAVVAGITAVVTLVAATVSAYSLVKSLGKSPEMEQAETEVGKAKVERAKIEGEAQTLKTEQAKTQQKINDNAAAEQNQATTNPNDPNFKPKADLAKETKALQDEFAQQQQDLDKKNTDFAAAEKRLNRLQKNFDSAERKHLEYYAMLSRTVGEFSQGLSKAAEAAGAGVKADIAMKKGAINAEQQILQGQQEIVRKANDAVAQSYNNSTEAMNQLIQSLKKMEDELVRAMSMTRN